ncbi:MAG: phage/plasmid replication domain-containing protein [Phocaeicola sp.]
MYDKLKLWIPRTSKTPDVLQYLDVAKEQTDINTGEVRYYGNMDGLKISIYMSGISIVGSLSKYYYPNNIYPLDKHSTAEAITKLSDNIHIGLSDARVTGLEFGTQFLMTRPVTDYLPKLGDLSRMERYTFGRNTLYYKLRGKQAAKTLCFYDKKADATAKGMELPIGFSDANLLKYELRYDKRITNQLKVNEVTASTLSKSSFYGLMMNQYQEHYNSIKKQSNLKINIMAEIKTVNDGFEAFMASLLSQGEQDKAEAFINELKSAKVFQNRNDYYRLKKKIQDISAKASVTESDELIKELDREIKNVGAYF